MTLYDDIGAGYATQRRTDPRIASAIWAALGGARTVVNVGAGSGSYEPPDRDVVAVEPSAVMRAQRPPHGRTPKRARHNDPVTAPPTAVRPRGLRGKDVRLTSERGGTIELGADVALGDRVRVHAAGGRVVIGAGATLGEGTTIVAHELVVIGAGAVLGARVAIIDAEPSFDDPETPTRLQPLRTAPVSVGAGAAIGHQAALCAGARVADGAVIAPGITLTA